MKRVATACALLLLGIAIWEIVATVRATSSVPDDAAWRRAAAVVREAYRPGDLIVFAPEWIDPVGRLHLGDLIPIEMAARMDDDRYARVWELALAPRDARRGEPAFRREVDGITVLRFDRTPVTVLADVGESERVLAEVGFKPRRCLQVVPPPDGTPVRKTFELPAGTLVGYAGLADVFTRRDIRAPATLEVEVGGKVVASVSPGVDDGWMRFWTIVPAGTVTFVVRASAPNRLLCFAAEVRR